MKHAGAIALVGAGGFLGSTARYAVALMLAPVTELFPFATLAVNILGSFLIGFLTEFTVMMTPLSPEVRLFLVTGFCGGFTTFSAYMYENTTMLRDGQLLYAGLYLSGSIAGGLLAFYTGAALAKLLST